MKRFVIALALMCSVSVSVFAGDMPTTGKSEPPPTPPSSTTTTTASALLVNVVLTVLSLR